MTTPEHNQLVESALEHHDALEELRETKVALQESLQALQNARMELRVCSDPATPKYQTHRAVERAYKVLSAAIAKAKGV